MVRSDYVESLAKYGMNNDRGNFRNVLETLISEERAKQHTIFADSLEDIIRNANHADDSNTLSALTNNSNIDSLIYEIKSRQKLSDLILSQEIQETCNEFIREQSRVSLLRAYNLEPRNRLLFTGEPGNGKTSLAVALANALMIPIYSVQYDGVIGSYLGETASRLKSIIEFVRTRRCVLFLDEFETLGKERGDRQDTGEIKRVVSSLLLQIDKLPSHVIVIGATNHPEMLDRAVWRRFQIRLQLNPPTKKQIAEWFVDFERKSNVPLDINPELLAEKLSGFSFSEINEFGTTLLRRYVLSLPDADMQYIIKSTLENWKTHSASAI